MWLIMDITADQRNDMKLVRDGVKTARANGTDLDAQTIAIMARRCEILVSEDPSFTSFVKEMELAGEQAAFDARAARRDDGWWVAFSETMASIS